MPPPHTQKREGNKLILSVFPLHFKVRTYHKHSLKKKIEIVCHSFNFSPTSSKLFICPLIQEVSHGQHAFLSKFNLNTIYFMVYGVIHFHRPSTMNHKLRLFCWRKVQANALNSPALCPNTDGMHILW